MEPVESTRRIRHQQGLLTLVAVCVDGLHRLADELPLREFAEITSEFADACNDVVQRHGGSVLVWEAERMLAAWRQPDDIAVVVKHLADALAQMFVVDAGRAATRPAFCIGVGSGTCLYKSFGSSVTDARGEVPSRIERIALEHVRRLRVVVDASGRDQFASSELHEVGAGVFALELPGAQS